jgi:hypothetical protein
MEEATKQLEHPRSNEEKLLEADPARRSRDMLFYEATVRGTHMHTHTHITWPRLNLLGV